MTKYIESEEAIDAINETAYEYEEDDKALTALYHAADRLNDLPAADVEPVRHAHWVKRMEHGVGRGYEVHTPIWSCSDCGRDYDPASCSIIKYCYICGAKMDGGQDE